MKITVLAGGYSPERDVSLTSGSLIANALIQNGHRVLLLDVYRGIPTLPADPDTLFLSHEIPTHSVTDEVPDLDRLKAECNNGDALIGPNVIDLCRAADKVFLALHGAMGENGQLQATLDSFGIAYTGSGYIGSLLAMDKDLSKRLFRDAHVPTPDWMYFDVRKNTREELLCRVGLPCVVKPCSCGSSVGISMADTPEELDIALAEAARWEDRILVEKKIVGREFTVGILNGKALPLVEIIPDSGFYDYKNKYQGTTREICPAVLEDADARRAQEICLRVFEALRLRGYARVDMLMDTDRQFWVLEANTLPGMTPTSLLPQAAAAVGLSYRQLCEEIVKL